MTTDTYPTSDQQEILSLKARAKGPFGSATEIRALRDEVDRFWIRTGSPAAEALRGDLWHAEQAMQGEAKPPTDGVLRGTGMLRDGTPTEETFTCSKAEFAADQGFEDDDPVVLEVLALEPGESTVFDMGAGGAWKIRCLTMDEAMAELDREATTNLLIPATTRDARDTLVRATELFGRKTRGFREAVRQAAEEMGTERNLSPAELARMAMEEWARPAVQVFEDGRTGDLYVREAAGGPLLPIDDSGLDSRTVSEVRERLSRVGVATLGARELGS